MDEKIEIRERKMMSMKNLRSGILLFSFYPFLLLLGSAILVLSACSPKVYLIDRQTVLEDEAAGEWPKFENDLLDKAKAKGPTPFAKTENNERKERLYNVLNGEMTGNTP